MPLTPSDPEWKKGSAELLVWSLLEDRPRHGYDISKLIQIRSGGALRFSRDLALSAAAPTGEEGWLEARWVEKSQQHRRRYYSLSPQGRKALRSKQKSLRARCDYGRPQSWISRWNSRSTLKIAIANS